MTSRVIIVAEDQRKLTDASSNAVKSRKAPASKKTAPMTSIFLAKEKNGLGEGGFVGLEFNSNETGFP
jgi:hypothetical protein